MGNKTLKYNPNTPNRKNLYYPPYQVFTVVECKKCGEMFEPICELKHICKKQNSYPKLEDINEQHSDS